MGKKSYAAMCSHKKARRVKMQKPTQGARVVGKVPWRPDQEIRGQVSHLDSTGVWIKFAGAVPKKAVAVEVERSRGGGSGTRCGAEETGTYFTWDEYKQHFTEEEDK